MKFKDEFEESKALIDLIVHHLPVFVSYVDSDQRYRFNNKMYEDQFGIFREEIYGKHIKEFLGEAAYKVVEKYVESALSGGKIHQELLVPYKSGGARYISMSFVPHIVEEEKVAGFFVMVKDITQRKQAEQELEEYKNRLKELVKERTEKLLNFAETLENEILLRKKTEEKLKRYSKELERSNQALNDFAAIASHDLQEPLRKVMLFSERLKNKYTDVLDASGKDYLLRMQKATERMRYFIKNLLHYSRVSSKVKVFQPTNLEKIVADMLLNLKLRISESGGRVEVNQLPVLDADEFQMSQLFQNLLGNALKFYREGTPPVVVVNSRLLDNNFWEITVEDNGIGFDQKFADKIFKPFERLHGRSAYEGSGMGLSICQKIIERHGGTITTKSVPQKGTTMIVTLPEKQNQEEQ